MLSSSDDDCSDASSIDSFDRIERREARAAQLEAEQEIAVAAERQVAAAKSALQERFSVAKRLFDGNTQKLCDCSIRFFHRLDMALEHVRDNRRRFMVVFARDQPKIVGERLVFVKQYLVGCHQNFFRYAILASNDFIGVSLHEVIRSEDPVPMYFDIEIKQVCAVGRVASPHNIFAQYCKDTALNLCEEDINAIASEYSDAALQPFCEDECKAGVIVMKTFLQDVLSQLLEEFPGGFSILSSCRSDKFSIHVICSHLFCDGSYLSAPLLAYEVARRYIDWNIKRILSPSSSMERRFRLRSLMIDQWSNAMEIVSVGDNVEHRQKFSGFNDTPFDEGVYSRNHLMRAAGATKGDGSIPALHPVLEGGLVMSDIKNFGRVFPMTNEGQSRWEDHLIARPYRAYEHTAVVVGWQPSRFYPKIRGWYASSSATPRFLQDLEALYTIVLQRCACDRFVERRYTGRDYTPMNQNQATSLNANNSAPKEPICADDLFVAEDGTTKAFKFFKPNDFIRHDHGSGVETNASAKVFAGGFHCFVCGTSFGVIQEAAAEPAFECADTKIYETDDALAQIPILEYDPDWEAHGIDWDKATRKKWFVVQAPMGAGKTEQLCTFMDTTVKDKNWRVLVVSFRQFLASQQARRLGTCCYLGIPTDRLRQDPHPLTICVNSLWKLGNGTYDAIVLDEAGLIRRHFMSSTVTNVLSQVYEKFCRLIRGAQFVIMLQASLSQEDIQFYTEIDGVQSEDSTYVSAYKMIKPVKIHPIKWTTDCFQAFSNMVHCYKNSFDQDGCKQPFMVFCSQCNFAEYIVEFLRDVAKTVEGASPDRIKGIWASLKNQNDPFCVRFVKDAGEAATECDVLVCTSVIGAGFSVSRHFPSFHAFLFNNILDHHEEQQFIQRLRLKLDDALREGISRDSYMFVEKGHGDTNLMHVNVLRQDYNKVRFLMTNDDASAVTVTAVAVMQNTQARVEVERSVSRSKHDTLWIQWGLSVESPFETFPEGDEDDKKTWKLMKVEFMKRNNSKRLDIADMVRAEYEEMGMSEYLRALEIGPGLKLFRALSSREQVKNLESAFSNPKLVTHLIKVKYPNKADQDKVIGGKTRLNGVAKASWNLAQWIANVYKNLRTEQTGSFFEHVKKKPYSKAYIQQFSLFNLAETIIQPMLSDTTISRPYLVAPGTTPFFNGLSIIPHESICQEIKSRLEPHVHDDMVTREALEKTRRFVRTFMAKHDARDTYLVKLYTTPAEVRKLIKKVFTGLGLDFRNDSNRRISIDGVVYHVSVSSTASVDFALMLAAKYTQANVLSLLSILRYSDNLSEADKEWVDDGIGLYNDAAVSAGVTPIVLTRPTGMMTFTVIPRRLRELEVENANAGLERMETEEERERTRNVRRRLSIMRERVSLTEAALREEAHLRDFIVTDAVEVDDDEDLTQSLDDIHESTRSSNPFVLTEAAEAED